MNVVVLGAGVEGVTAAYYLAADGHQVTVIDRREAPSLETSFANGGQISSVYSQPWASPATLLKAIKWLGRPEAPLIFKWWRYDPTLWAWLARFLYNCLPSRVPGNTASALSLAIYARDSLKALREETSIQYDARTQGILYIHETEKGLAHAVADANALTAQGFPQKILTPSEMAAHEPALAGAVGRIKGAILSPDDETGDIFLFTQALAKLCEAKGVTFRFGETIKGLETGGGKVTAVTTDRGRVTGDHYVLALGPWSPLIAKTAGLNLPIYPAKGYSLTLPLEPGTPLAPQSSVTDDAKKVVYTRLGDRLRMAGTAELAGWDASITPLRIEVMRRQAASLFPALGDFKTAVPWAGLRPKTPDSLPYVCKTPLANLVLDTGHGTLGWTMAAGSGRLVADLVSGKKPDIDPSGLGLKR